MTHVSCRLTAKNRDQLRNPTLGNRVWAAFTFLPSKLSACVRLCVSSCLRSWLEQDTSCPTCRTSLSDLHNGQRPASDDLPAVPADPPVTNPRRHRARRTNRFHFDGNTPDQLVDLLLFRACLQCFDAVGWASGRASGL